MFEKATRLKLRFETTKGLLSVEDLWELPLTSPTSKVNLDEIARGLHHKVTTQTEVSFVNPTAKSAAAEKDQLALDIVKHVIGVRLAENEAAAKARANAEQKKKILEILDEKDTESLKGKSTEELRAMVAGL
ncbi:hypothetical protein [Armatimonas rosea]|uniref:Uncharacterized protein n=1 Tax=Armatimonas rosea TaxID=685828 RepID=A0A7W9W8G7_ARMRO|nr:hypothetical protein [Armatimonas rosea]MBB6053539.1 hypothetical protein [Armatimonas rosea]